MMDRLSQSLRTVVAGTLCLSILCGVLVVHAWPLWTGQSVVLPVTPVDPRDLFRGEYVQLDTPARRLTVQSDGRAQPGSLSVTAVGSWWQELPSDPSDRFWSLLGRVVYVQLEPRGEAGEWQPVSISHAPVADRTNLRGRVVGYNQQIQGLDIDYGIDSYFMQEGTAKPIEDALRMRRRVQMEIAVTSSGHARIRRLLVDGVATGQ